MSDSQSRPKYRTSRVAVIGASGYGGLQTIRLLQQHPEFEITYLGGSRSVGKRWNELCPFIELAGNPQICSTSADQISDHADFAILSLPNGVASQLVPQLLRKNVRVIDLSADYRYRSLEIWKQNYVKENLEYNRDDSQLCSEAIYGIPEWNSELISKAKIVAAPGCFPTASLLPLLPFLKQGLIEFEGLVIDAKTGTSGGGRSPKEHLLFAESSESISPYAVIGHRHTSEIEQMAREVSGQQIKLQFTPHLVPMVRGLLSTVYAKLRDPGLTADDCTTVLKALYRNDKTVEVLPVGVYPATKWVRNTCKAMISVQVDTRTSQLVLMSVIDNLVKGQAGQGIQCLNLMAGLPQETGLPLNVFYP